VRGEKPSESWLAQVVAVEQGGEQRAFVSLDHLERLAKGDLTRLARILDQLRSIFESWQDRTSGVYVNNLQSHQTPAT